VTPRSPGPGCHSARSRQPSICSPSHPAQLRDEGLRYWEQERRRYRLTTRPLISQGNDQLILIPRLIEVTQDIYAAYLLNGRMPWPPSVVPRAVADAFNNFRNRQKPGA